MRTFKRLFEQVVSLENLERASRRAIRGKRRREPVARFLLHQDSRLLELHRTLMDGTWRPQPCGLQLIYEPKPRAITIASLENNIVHHALVDVLEPLVGRSYVSDTYACLTGRGAHRAILRHQALQRNHRFLLQLDIKKYFPSLPHARLLEVLGRRIADARVMALLKAILQADDGLYLNQNVLDHLADPDYFGSPGVGVPVGTLTSQFFGNFYLDGLDHFIKRELKVPGFIRYMDNVTCFGRHRAQLRIWEHEIGDWLKRERGLRLHHRHDALRPCHARILYLGYEINRETRRPGTALFHRLERKLDRLHPSGLKDRKLTALRRSLESYRALVAF